MKKVPQELKEMLVHLASLVLEGLLGCLVALVHLASKERRVYKEREVSRENLV